MDFLQYVDMDSFLHKLDPRTKFFFFIAMAILTSLIKTGVALLFIFIMFMIIWVSCRIGKYILILLKKLKVLILFIFLLWMILGMFTVNEGPSIFSTNLAVFGKEFTVSFEWFDIYKSYVFSMRIFLMVSSFYTVIISTNFSEIILGLRKTKVSYAVAFGIGLVFQIIPMIIKEFYAIMEAQSSRGLEVEKCSAVAKLKNYVTVSLPLLFRVLSKGHAISLAMHYYKLDFKVKRTSYKVIKASYRDFVFLGATVLCTAVSIVLHFTFYMPV